MTFYSSFQVVKQLTDGGADYSFECVGDTGVVSTALQSCSDVIFCSSFSFLVTMWHKVYYYVQMHFLLSCLVLSGMGSDCNSWCTKSKARSFCSLWIASLWKNTEGVFVWRMETQIWYTFASGEVRKQGNLENCCRTECFVMLFPYLQLTMLN